MDTLNLKVYNTLRKELNLDEEKSRAITQAIEGILLEDKIKLASKEFVEKEVEYRTTNLATREDLERGLKEQTRWVLGAFISLALMILGLYIKK